MAKEAPGDSLKGVNSLDESNKSGVCGKAEVYESIFKIVQILYRTFESTKNRHLFQSPSKNVPSLFPVLIKSHTRASVVCFFLFFFYLFFLPFGGICSPQQANHINNVIFLF